LHHPSRNEARIAWITIVGYDSLSIRGIVGESSMSSMRMHSNKRQQIVRNRHHDFPRWLFAGRATPFILGAVVAGSTVVASAQSSSTPPDPSRQLAPVNVVAVSPLPGIGVSRDQLPYTVQTGRGATLDTSTNGSLAESLLRDDAGINAADIQGSPFQPDITFRGYTASSLVGAPQGLSVYLDGVRVNAPFGDIVNWDLIPEAAIDRTLLVPGSNPIYGLNTLGGALVLTTKSGITAPGVSATMRVGSFGRKRGDLAYGWHDGSGLHAFVAGTYFEEDGWRDHSDGHLGNLFAKAGKLTATGEIEATLLHGNSTIIGNGLTPETDYTEDGPMPGMLRRDRAAAYTWPDQSHNRLWQGTLRGRHFFGDGAVVDVLGYVRRASRDTINGDVAEDYEDYVDQCAEGFNSDGTPVGTGCPVDRAEALAIPPAVMNTTSLGEHSWGLSASLGKAWGTHRLTTGVDYNQSRVDYTQHEQAATFTGDRGVQPLPGSPVAFFSGVGGKARSFGIYATDTWAIRPRTFVTGSLRWNASRVSSTLDAADTGPQPASTFDYTKLNPALGVVQRFEGGLALYANASQSNRVPTVVELGCADPDSPCRLPAGLQSDPRLDQVTARTIEIGTRWRPNPSTSLWISAYRTDNRNDILFLRAPNTQQGYFSNFAKTRNQGIDAAVDQVVGPVTVSVRYSYLDATYQATGELASGERTIAVTPGMRIAGLPRNTIKLTATWHINDAATLAMDAIAVDRIGAVGNEDGYVEDPSEGDAQRVDASVAGYVVANLRGSYRFDRHLSLFGGVSNLFDRRYSTFGALAGDVFPDGTLVQPAIAPSEAPTARFVAPGAPRAFYVALRYEY
jgi:outer membrane receptor protein involved in Fe transport